MTNKSIKLNVNTVGILATYILVVFNSYASSTKVTKQEINENIQKEIEIEKNHKINALENFFNGYSSPLSKHSETFVAVADKYNLDYRLLPAISCMESSCGKKLIPNSYNPFGWGIHGDSAIYFNDYDEAIETVGRGISENYFEKGYDTPEKIAPIYTPPNSENWLKGVNFFISKINEKHIELSLNYYSEDKTNL